MIIFYLDFEGSIREERTEKALSHLGEITTFLHVLGSYPKGEITKHQDNGSDHLDFLYQSARDENMPQIVHAWMRITF